MATMAANKVWTPVEDGEISSFAYVDNGGKLMGIFAGDDYTDWYATEELPDNIRLCHLVESDAPGVTVAMTPERVAALKFALECIKVQYGDGTSAGYWKQIKMLRAMLDEMEATDE